jgi:hypothetical protein
MFIAILATSSKFVHSAIAMNKRSQTELCAPYEMSLQLKRAITGWGRAPQMNLISAGSISLNSTFDITRGKSLLHLAAACG